MEHNAPSTWARSLSDGEIPSTHRPEALLTIHYFICLSYDKSESSFHTFPGYKNLEHKLLLDQVFSLLLNNYLFWILTVRRLPTYSEAILK